MTEDCAIIVAPHWEKGGSNNIFACQIRHYRNKNWLCVVVLVNEFKTRASLSRVSNSELPADKIADLHVGKFQRYFRFLASTRILKNDRNGPMHRHFINKTGRLDDDLRSFLTGKRVREICVNWFDNIDAAVRIRSDLKTPDTPIVVHTHDVMANHNYTRGGKPFDLTKFEIANLLQADRLVHVSEEDAEYFGPKVKKPQITSFISLHPDLERAIGTLQYRPMPRTVLYIGSWNYENPKGVMWFFRQVMPYVKGDIRFFFAGDICDFIASNLWHECGRPNVRLLYRVDDLIDLYQNVQMVMLPDMRGTGASVKLVEALAMGLPFVAQSAALRGLPKDARDALAPYVADKPRDFADRIDEVLSSPPGVRTQDLYWKYFSNDAWSRRIDAGCRAETGM